MKLICSASAFFLQQLHTASVRNSKLLFSSYVLVKIIYVCGINSCTHMCSIKNSNCKKGKISYTHHTNTIPPTAATRRSTPAVTPTGTATVSTATPCATTTGGEETTVADVLMYWRAVVGVLERSDDRVAEISAKDAEGGTGEKPASL